MRDPSTAPAPLADSAWLLPHEAVAAVLAWPAAPALAEQPEEGVFAAGVLLAEMLSGQASAQRAADCSPDALERRYHDLPEDWGRNIDPPLQAQISRALSLQPEDRFAHVDGFKEALSAWAGTPAARTLETLLARMRRQGDFPALSSAMGRILKVANSDDDSLEDLTREVLHDVALTQQLLRLVNSAQYAQVSGMVTTVSRAVGLVGFNGVRNLALGLRLLEHMPDQTHAVQLKAQFLRALMAGSLAAELCTVAQVREDAFLGALFQNLGRLLTGFYFPAEAAQIEQALIDGRFSGGESSAFVHLLGLSDEDFGTGVARGWGLPEDILYCMRRPFGRPPTRRPQAAREYLRWLAVAANEITSALIEPGGGDTAVRVKAVTDRYARVLGLAPEDFADAVVHAQTRLKSLAEAMGLPAGTTVALTRPLGSLSAVPAQGASAGQAALAQAVPASPKQPAATPPVLPRERGAASAPAPLAETVPVASRPAPLAPAVATPALAPSLTRRPDADGARELQARAARMARQHEALKALSQRLQEVSAQGLSLAEGIKLSVAGLQQALGADRVLFCLREAAVPVLSARHAQGLGVASLQTAFRVDLGAGSVDVLATACHQGRQLWVQDAFEPGTQARLPVWLREQFRPAGFWLLPLVHRDAVFALLYADVGESERLMIDPGSRELLQQLGQLLLALFRQRQSR